MLLEHHLGATVMEHAYSIYGLCLEVDKLLPGLMEIDSSISPDLSIWVQTAPTWVAGVVGGSRQLRFDSGDAGDELPATVQVWRYDKSKAFHFLYRDGIEFVIDRHGRRISVTCTESATLEDAASYLVGVILGFALRLRGRVALHASVVVIDGRAVLLLGHGGSGKSTMAAAFAAVGHEILADDVCVLIESDGKFWVAPAYPGIRLWPDAVEALFGSSEALPKVSSGWDKRLLSLSDGEHRFRSTRLPIGALYWLTGSHLDGNTLCMSVLRASELMMKLVSASYPNYLLNGDMRSKEFATLAKLAADVPGSEITVCNNLFAVHEGCRAIIADFRTLKV